MLERYNSPADLPGQAVRSFLARAGAGVKAGDCTVWSGLIDRGGYGSVSWKSEGRMGGTGAHRIAYLLGVGDIPSGYVIDHLCRNRACFNVDHLEPVLPLVNARRGTAGQYNANKQECVNGHLFDAANLALRVRSDGGVTRVCKKCRYIRKNEYRLRKALAAA